MKILLRSLAVALVLLPAGSLWAQSQTGSISGVVKDDQGGALPGATITLTGRTGARTALTDHEGSYRFPAIDPGTYAIEIAMSGFQDRKQEGVVVTISAKLTLDYTLKVRSMAETVTVESETPVVDVTSAETSSTLSQDLLFNMPLQRFAPNLLNYAPGINDDWPSAAGAGPQTRS